VVRVFSMGKGGYKNEKKKSRFQPVS
jgi:hypothetical protein